MLGFSSDFSFFLPVLSSSTLNLTVFLGSFLSSFGLSLLVTSAVIISMVEAFVLDLSLTGRLDDCGSVVVGSCGSVLLLLAEMTAAEIFFFLELVFHSPRFLVISRWKKIDNII